MDKVELENELAMNSREVERQEKQLQKWTEIYESKAAELNSILQKIDEEEKKQKEIRMKIFQANQYLALLVQPDGVNVFAALGPFSSD